MSISFTFSNEKAIRLLNMRRFTREQAIGYIIGFGFVYFVWIPSFFGLYFFVLPIITEFIVLRKCYSSDNSSRDSLSNFLVRFAFIGLIACKYSFVPFILIKLISEASDFHPLASTALLIVPYAIAQKARLKMHSKVVSAPTASENYENSEFLAQLDSMTKAMVSGSQQGVVPELRKRQNASNRCPKCGGKISSTSRKCPTCSAILQPSEVLCPTCGYVNKSGFESCMFCNNPLQISAQRDGPITPEKIKKESIPIGIILDETFPVSNENRSETHDVSVDDSTSSAPGTQFKNEDIHIELGMIDPLKSGAEKNGESIVTSKSPEPQTAPINSDVIGLTTAPKYDVPALTFPNHSDEENQHLSRPRLTQFSFEEKESPDRQSVQENENHVCLNCTFFNREQSRCDLGKRPLYDYYCYDFETCEEKIR